MVVTSTEDQLISPEAWKQMAAAIPSAELVVIEGVGHLSNMERPDEFTGLLKAHARRCGLAA